MAERTFITVDDIVCPLPEQLEVIVNAIDGISFIHGNHSTFAIAYVTFNVNCVEVVSWNPLSEPV